MPCGGRRPCVVQESGFFAGNDHDMSIQQICSISEVCLPFHDDNSMDIVLYIDCHTAYCIDRNAY